MRRLLLKSTLFVLPFIPILGFPLFILIYSGEFTPATKVVTLQEEQPILYGTAYSLPDKPFKLASTLQEAPDILALGNSRVSQFRRAFFPDSVSFYNATMAVSAVEDFRRFLDQIPEGEQPELILAGLDHWFFNENFEDYDHASMPERFQAHVDRSDVFERQWRTIWTDYFAGRYDLATLTRNDQAIGLNAKVKHLGFRRDGSIYYGHIVANPNNPGLEDYGFRHTLKRIKTGRFAPWIYGEEVSDKALKELDVFLQECATRGIYVIGFLPIFPHAIYEQMLSMPEYAYLTKLNDELRPLFEVHGFEFYDFSDIRTVGSSDIEALDGNHGSEKSHLRMVIRMIEQGSRIGAYADAQYLKEKLRASRGNNLEVFETKAYPTSRPTQVTRSTQPAGNRQTEPVG